MFTEYPFRHFRSPYKVDSDSKARVEPDQRDAACLHCGEKFGTRLTVPVGDQASYDLYHVQCADEACDILNQVACDKWKADKAAYDSRHQAERDERKAQRGDWDSYVSLDYLRPSEVGEDEALFNRVCRWADRQGSNGRAGIQNFVQKLGWDEPDPQYTMSWSLQHFHNAARVHVADCYVKRAFNNGMTAADLRQWALKDLIQKAKSAAPNSTSATSNLAEVYELEVLAELVEVLMGTSLFY